MTERREPTRPSATPSGGSQLAFTLIHVWWFTAAVGEAAIVFLTLRKLGMPVRIVITILAFILAIAITHLLVVFIVTAIVIPRLRPGSAWSREVDSYMASVFPGQW
jgi:hypothetical protein